MRRPVPSLARHRGSRGLTIIEIIIVIAVVSLMVAMVVLGFGSSRAAEVTRTVNQVGNMIRYGYDKARVTGGYYRLHIDLEKGAVSLQEGSDKMYLPATDRDGEIIEFDASKAEDQADRDRRAEDAFNRSVQAQVYEEGEGADEAAAGGDVYRAQARKVPRRKPPLFAGFDDEESLSGLIKPVVMPEGVKIVSVRTADDLAAISEGEGSIYFFPRGRTQQAHILLEDEQSDAKWTIKVSPLTGRVTIEDGHDELVLPDDRSEQEDELGRRIERRTL